MKSLILSCLRAYKNYLSPLLGPACRYVPSCSEYVYQAIEKKGVLRGALLGVFRILRCNPLSRGGHDPVI